MDVNNIISIVTVVAAALTPISLIVIAIIAYALRGNKEALNLLTRVIELQNVKSVKNVVKNEVLTKNAKYALELSVDKARAAKKELDERNKNGINPSTSS